MADRGQDRNLVRNVGTPRDAGRTSGGGSLGHEQPRDVEGPTNTRNTTGRRPDEKTGVATGTTSDPVMPADDATLKTRI